MLCLRLACLRNTGFGALERLLATSTLELLIGSSWKLSVLGGPRLTKLLAGASTLNPHKIILMHYLRGILTELLLRIALQMTIRFVGRQCLRVLRLLRRLESLNQSMRHQLITAGRDRQCLIALLLGDAVGRAEIRECML